MRFNRRIFTASAAAAATLSTSLLNAFAHQSATPAASPAGYDAIQAKLDTALAETGAPGGMVLLDHPDTGIQTWAVGTANVETGQAMSSDMHMRVGSISKTYMATVILQLADEGLFKLDDTLGATTDTFDVLPNADTMTIRHILGMEAGLNDFLSAPGYMEATTADMSRAYTNEELLSYAAEQEAVGAPGEQVVYSNTGYLVLGMLAEELTGSPYQDLITTRIIDELGLANTSIPDIAALPDPSPRGYLYVSGNAMAAADAQSSPEATMATPVATPIQPWDTLGDETGPYDVTDFNPTSVSAAGAMVSTLEDTNTWLKALADGSLLSDEMHAAQIAGKPLGNGEARYGLGAIVSDTMIGHNGAVPGFQSNALAFTDRGMRVVAFTNAYPGQNGPDSTTPLIMPLVGE